MITLTERAVREVRRIVGEKGMPETTCLRLGVAGGGCAGFEYVLEFSPAPEEEDAVMESGGIRVVAAPEGMQYLRGLEIDFDDGLLNRGFKFRNPNASRTCGCGTSFAV